MISNVLVRNGRSFHIITDLFDCSAAREGVAIFLGAAAINARLKSASSIGDKLPREHNDRRSQPGSIKPYPLASLSSRVALSYDCSLLRNATPYTVDGRSVNHSEELGLECGS